MSPGGMDAKAGWAFVIVAALVATGASFVSGWIGLLIMAGGAFASTFMTKAGKGAGAGMAVVGNLIFMIGLFIVTKMTIASAMADMEAQMAAQGVDANASALASSAGGALGTVAIIIGLVVVGIPSIIVSIVAAIIGASARPKDAAAAPPAAAPPAM